MVGGDPGGGSIELGRLIDLYADALIADLLQIYQVDLRDVFVDGSGVTPRYLLALIIELPHTSRTVALRRGGAEFTGWSEDRYIQVGIYNALRELTYVTIAANTDKKHKPRPPKPYPLPVEKAIKKSHKPGSFGYMALATMNQVKKTKEGR